MCIVDMCTSDYRGGMPNNFAWHNRVVLARGGGGNLCPRQVV